jgi:hypothetical protein
VIYGNTYLFKVRSRNSVGLSDFSEPLSILCAQIPDVPNAPYLVRNYDQIEIRWDAPWDGGTPIFTYTIEFRHNDDTSFSQVGVSCDGTDAAVVASRFCSLPIATLKAEPFVVDWGKTAHARVSATNIKGTCDYSEVGFGGIIMKIPDAPVDLRNKGYKFTNAFDVYKLWQEGPVFYGAQVIDFTLSWDSGLGDGSLAILATGILPTGVDCNAVLNGALPCESEYITTTFYDHVLDQ